MAKLEYEPMIKEVIEAAQTNHVPKESENAIVRLLIPSVLSFFSEKRNAS
jgi:hypothetical protein